MIFNLLFLKHLSKSYQYLKITFIYKKEKQNRQTGRPCAGQAGLQAGWAPEATGLWSAQAGHAGRAGARMVRPCAGPGRGVQAGHPTEPSGLRPAQLGQRPGASARLRRWRPRWSTAARREKGRREEERKMRASPGTSWRG